MTRRNKVLGLGIAGLLVGLLAACSGESADTLSTPTGTPNSSESSVETTAPSPPATKEPTYPSGDKVLPGYPVLVDTASLDSRVSSWIKSKKAVALAPGVYAAYSPVETDLDAYMDAPNDGDCTVRAKFFPDSPGACWSGVEPGTQEP